MGRVRFRKYRFNHIGDETMSITRIYLAGAINGCTDAQMSDWRDAMKARSYTFDAKFLDPTDRDYRGRELTLGVPSEIVTLDKRDIEDSDYLVVWYEKPSVGTSMEIFYAHSLTIPIILIDKREDRSKNLSPWLVYHSTALVQSIDDAVETLNIWSR